MYRQRLDEMNVQLRDSYPEEQGLVMIKEDDLDASDIAAYSQTVRDDSDSYTTLSQATIDNENKQKKLKKQLA